MRYCETSKWHELWYLTATAQDIMKVLISNPLPYPTAWDIVKQHIVFLWTIIQFVVQTWANPQPLHLLEIHCIMHSTLSYTPLIFYYSYSHSTNTHALFAFHLTYLVSLLTFGSKCSPYSQNTPLPLKTYSPISKSDITLPAKFHYKFSQNKIWICPSKIIPHFISQSTMYGKTVQQTLHMLALQVPLNITWFLC